MDNKDQVPATNPDVDHFEKWAPTYEQSFRQRLYFGPVHAKMLDTLVRINRKDPPGCILDVGCGTGRLLRAVSAVWPKAQLLGVDPAEQMISEARRLNVHAIFKLGTAEALPIPDQTVDLVLSSLSFHHWANQQKGIMEIARVLRPGGWFCLADHALLLAKYWGEKVKSSSEISEMMNTAGLTVRQHHTMGIRFVLITLAQK